MSAKPILIAGPTASGKTALALALAEIFDAEIINADALQLYADLTVLTARPNAAEQARAPHHLFGVVDAQTAWSAGDWLRAAVSILDRLAQAGRRAIVVGGTGLYFEALTRGLADVPDPGAQTRAAVDALYAEDGIGALRAEAQRLDPDASARVLGADRQRLSRIIAVAQGTGKPLSAWRAETRPTLSPGAWIGIALAPTDRDALYARCDARAAAMWAQGALDEVRGLMARGYDPDRGVGQALGVAPIADHLLGRCDGDTALARLRQDTRRYAKRQLTWIRNRMADWSVIDTLDPARQGLSARAALETQDRIG
ncbi:MAG: tRNA (adenosine(37)-N6)-dimethylallyltransferase MiaA [Maricaulaceae bacterium]